MGGPLVWAGMRSVRIWARDKGSRGTLELLLKAPVEMALVRKTALSGHVGNFPFSTLEEIERVVGAPTPDKIHGRSAYIFLE